MVPAALLARRTEVPHTTKTPANFGLLPDGQNRQHVKTAEKDSRPAPIDAKYQQFLADMKDLGAL